MRGDLHRVAESLGLRRAGSEFKGACPICGGNDRFHIRTGRSAELLVHCRHGCRFSDIARELERRGLIDGDGYVPPTHRKDDLEYCDFLILALEGAIANGQRGLEKHDQLAIARTITKVDAQRAERLRTLRGQIGVKDDS